MEQEGDSACAPLDGTRPLLVVSETFELTWSQAESPETPEAPRRRLEEQRPSWIVQLMINA